MTWSPGRWSGLAWGSLNSVSGRTFWILTLGTAAAAVVTMTLVEVSRRSDFEEVRLTQLVSRVVQLEDRWRSTNAPERAAAIQRLLGVEILATTPPMVRNPELEERLRSALGEPSQPQAGLAPTNMCLPQDAEPLATPKPVANGAALPLECWVISFALPGDQRQAFAIIQPPVITPGGAPRNPVFLLVLIAASALMSILVARFITRPLRRLSDAATAFSVSLDSPDADVSGPREVRAALSAFNIMQARVRSGFLLRTQLLASISHDLQTPLTRMRLRLEQVSDDVLRDRLVADIRAMQTLVQEGLALARSHESTEDWSIVDIDSLVGSLAADASEFGADVSFVSGCGCRARIKPNALARAINNLIDNAVKYGGNAALSCRLEKDRILIQVRDSGPGIADPTDPQLFEPFHRSPACEAVPNRGAGIGLTIAKAQAALSGATIRLENHAIAGLVAEVALVFQDGAPSPAAGHPNRPSSQSR